MLNVFVCLIGFYVGVGFEHEIVTEFPAELSKKRKLNKYGCWSDTRKGDADGLHNHKSVFSKRNFNKHVSPAGNFVLFLCCFTC